jgi:predicted dehydrogenase
MIERTFETMNAVTQARIIIVGAGLRGRMFADVVEKEREAEFLGFVDPYLSSDTEVIIAGRPVPHWESAEEAFVDVDPTAVIIATPDFLHADAVVQFAQRGCAIMLEKPVATTEEDSARIEEAVNAAGVYCMVAFENRWNTPFVKVRDAVESGDAGSPIFQSARLSNSYFVPTTMLSWAAQSSPLWFLMPHTIDLVQWIAGSNITSVTAMGSRGVLAERGIDTLDVVHALAHLADGSTASLTSAWVLPDGHPAPVDFTYELVGTRSSLFTDVGRSGLQVHSDRHRTLGLLDGVFDGFNSSAPAWMARRFIADLIAGREPETPLQTGLQVNRVLFAIERSLASGSTEIV